ncbi:hypothetical protein [Nocardioides sp. 503]|uniref:hypothetical protein n=1 Tax=Nocardioides sp. 503 TaxID=2508326 RepID=UPI0010702231|nr:hypothetical protein [Nocardioides sp. 503]
MTSRTIALTACAGLLVLSGAGAGFAAASLPKNSVGTLQIKKSAVTGAKVKDGSLSAADLGAKARAKLRGAPGPAGATGPAGPAGPSTSVFAARNTPQAISAAPVAVVTLDVNGPSKITVDRLSQLVLQATITIGNNANGGATSVIECQLQVDDGSGFDAVGVPMRTDSFGNSGHDQTTVLSVVAATNVPAGSYDAGLFCYDDLNIAASVPLMRTGALVAIATGPGPVA